MTNATPCAVCGGSGKVTWTAGGSTTTEPCEMCIHSPAPRSPAVAPGEQKGHNFGRTCTRCGGSFLHAEGCSMDQEFAPSAPAPSSGEEETEGIAERLKVKRSIIRRHDPLTRGLTLSEQDSLLLDAEFLLARFATLTARLAAAEQKNKEMAAERDTAKGTLAIASSFMDRPALAARIVELEARVRALEEENARLRDDISKTPRILPPVMRPELTFDDEPRKAP